MPRSVTTRPAIAAVKSGDTAALTAHLRDQVAQVQDLADLLHDRDLRGTEPVGDRPATRADTASGQPVAGSAAATRPVEPASVAAPDPDWTTVPR